MAIIADALKITPAATLTGTSFTSSVVQSTAGSALILNAPGSGRLSGRTFTVVVNGYASVASGTGTATIQPILYGDASLATVTTKPLFSASAGTLAYTSTAAVAVPFQLYVEFDGDTVSQKLQGIAQAVVNTTVTQQVTTVAAVSAINFTSEPPVKFALGFTSGGTLGATPKIVVTDFHIEQV